MAGGLTKNPVLMQIYADVLRLPLSVIGSEQGPALGSAIHAAVAAGAHPDVPAAAEAMGRVRTAPCTCRTPLTPIATTSCSPSTPTLRDHFGRGGSDVMHTLKRIRREAAAVVAG